MDSFSDMLAWLLAAVVFWAMFNSSSKRKNTKEYQMPTSCFCDIDAALNLCPACTTYAEEKAQKNNNKLREIKRN